MNECLLLKPAACDILLWQLQQTKPSYIPAGIWSSELLSHPPHPALKSTYFLYISSSSVFHTVVSIPVVGHDVNLVAHD